MIDMSKFKFYPFTLLRMYMIFVKIKFIKKECRIIYQWFGNISKRGVNELFQDLKKI